MKNGEFDDQSIRNLIEEKLNFYESLLLHSNHR